MAVNCGASTVPYPSHAVPDDDLVLYLTCLIHLCSVVPPQVPPGPGHRLPGDVRHSGSGSCLSALLLRLGARGWVGA